MRSQPKISVCWRQADGDAADEGTPLGSRRARKAIDILISVRHRAAAAFRRCAGFALASFLVGMLSSCSSAVSPSHRYDGAERVASGMGL